MAQTVRELVADKGRSTALWLCPHIVNNISFNTDPLLQGIECTVGTIPDPLLDKQVRQTYREEGLLCIIWQND